MRFLYIFLIILESTTVYAEPKDAYMVDRLSMIMTGMPALPEQIDGYAQGKKTLAELAEEFRLHPRFEDKFAEYWTDVLGITIPRRWSNQVYLSGSSRKPTTTKLTYEYGKRRKYPLDAQHSTIVISTTGGYGIHCTKSKLAGLPENTQFGFFYHIQNIADTVDPNLKKEIQHGRTQPQCGCKTDAEIRPIAVKPWWNPRTHILACPGLKKPEVCGENLQKCWPNTHSHLEDSIAYSIAMEPGYLAAKTVTEDRPWTDLVLTSDGVANAAMLSFLNNELSKEFRKLSGSGSYPNIENHQNLPEALADPTGVELISQTGSKFVRYNRGPMHAGILSSIGFALKNNGSRSYANASRQALLCREFNVPNGIDQVVSDETDLTKKPFCKVCHVQLEPLASAFRQLPLSGEDNFYFFTSENVSGSYEGKAVGSLKDLGRVYSESPYYSQCAVKHAFQFIVGREMNEEELMRYLPPLVSLYQEKSQKMWPIIKEIIVRKWFTGAVQNEAE